MIFTLKKYEGFIVLVFDKIAFLVAKTYLLCTVRGPKVKYATIIFLPQSDWKLHKSDVPLLLNYDS